MHSKFVDLVTAKDIQSKEIPPINWAIENLIPEGLTLLTGRPKAGKSFMAFDMALAITQGEKFLNKFPTVKGKVLYIPFEDNERRIQNRLNDLLQGGEAPPDLLFPSELFFPKIDQEGVDVLEEILQQTKDLRLIIIDTFGAAISDGFNNLGLNFKDDYGFMSKFQKLALEFQVGILLIHHTRKLTSENVFDEVVGSTGVTASPDTLLMLRKTSDRVQFHITGRDIKESIYEVSFDSDCFKWEILSEDFLFAYTADRQQIIDLFESDPTKELQIKDIAELTGKTRAAISQIIRKMKQSGEIQSGSSYGFYKLPKPN